MSLHSDDIERLTRLHDVLGMQLDLLLRRSRLTPREEQQVKHIKQRKLQMKDRIARAQWLARMQRETPAAE
jgi:uncharacterized protein YdcH (DUF465 family)